MYQVSALCQITCKAFSCGTLFHLQNQLASEVNHLSSKPWTWTWLQSLQVFHDTMQMAPEPTQLSSFLKIAWRGMCRGGGKRVIPNQSPEIYFQSTCLWRERLQLKCESGLAHLISRHSSPWENWPATWFGSDRKFGGDYSRELQKDPECSLLWRCCHGQCLEGHLQELSWPWAARPGTRHLLCVEAHLLQHPHLDWK
jgi:hypothetical protein